jgi:threonine/homoserine/homoserine lactone efflux protein
MSGIDFLIKGLILGISVAAPVGPIGLLCINRTLNKRFLAGFATGMGAAVADAFYGFVAGFGLTAISSFLLEHKFWIQLAGVIILSYFGVKTMISKSAANTNTINGDGGGLFKDFLSSFFLTVTNPMTILFFVAAFTGLGIVTDGNNVSDSFIFVSGVLLGSAVWWLFLAGFTSAIKHKVSETVLNGINIFSGLIIIGFALYMLTGLF